MKRKTREDEEGIEVTAPTVTTSDHGSTIFVSNLSYATTNATLENAFSNIAPIKSAFVVFQKSSEPEVAPVSKGVGYVTFAIKEDAENAMGQYGSEKERFIVDARKVRLQWANRKATKDEAAPASTEALSPKKSRPRPITFDAQAIRTLVISNTPKDVTTSTLWKKIRKQDGAESVEWPVKDPRTGQVLPGVAHALFKDPASAQAALAKLHAHVYKGCMLSAALKKRVDALQRVNASEGKVAGPSRAGRLIIRNLPWNISENDLNTLFLPYGPIHSVHIPTTTSSSTNKKPRFAFVWMLSKSDAEVALGAVNGRKVAAGLAQKAAEKAAHKKAKRKRKNKDQPTGDEEAKVEGNESELPQESSPAPESGEHDESEDKPEIKDAVEDEGQVVAVDWALSKERWEEAQRKAEEVAEAEVSDDGSESQEEDGGAIGVHDGESDSDAGSDSDGSDGSESKMDLDDDDEQPHNPPPPEEGTTLFVRNVPFEASDEDLRLLFRVFGSLRYARVTRDHETGRGRGTGFVCFWKVEDASAALEEAQRVKTESGMDSLKPKKVNPFSMLTADPSSSLATKLVLMGRMLDVTRAVNREEAGRLKVLGERSREKKDSRHLYLMREGVIFESSPSAQSITPAELERRQASFNARKALLKGNPSLFISRTRLSVRQLPTFVTERVLKRLGLHAKRAFQDEVRAGTREALTADELDVDRTIAEELRAAEAAEAVANQTSNDTKPKKGKMQRATGVKQAKIARQAERAEPLTGKGKSRGYGFLEMDRHSDALRVLRWANNREGTAELMWGWWKEELQDVVKRYKSTKAGSKALDDEEAVAEKARIELIEKKIVDMDRDKGPKGKTLLVEFSIENVVVTKRRAAKERGGDKPTAVSSDQKDVLGAKRRPSNRPDKTESGSKTRGKPNTSSRPSKRLKTEQTKDQPASEDKPGGAIGGIIGRKRKERKGKRG